MNQLEELTVSKCYSTTVLKAREDVLQGYFWEHGNQVNIWKRPSWAILVFISSTLSDSYREREFLMKVLSAELQRMGRESNVSFMFVDMRWGVCDEDTTEHVTWISCKEELERCRNDSMDTFFISLQVIIDTCMSDIIFGKKDSIYYP